MDDEKVRELGAIISGLAGLQAGDIQMAKKEAEKGVNEAAERTFGISEDRVLQIADELSKDVSAFFILLEHQ